jgi:hypothetical protein
MIFQRWWRYRYSTWKPRWWNWVIPQVRGTGDEYGRRCIVFHVPPVGFLVFAWRDCKCRACVGARNDRVEEVILFLAAKPSLKPLLNVLSWRQLLRLRESSAEYIEAWLSSPEGPGWKFTDADEECSK